MKLLFDTIIIINLDRCKDRYDRIISRIQNLGLDKLVKIVRLPAIDGTSIDEEWLSKNKITPLADYYDSYRGRGLTMGEIGCAISHFKAWEMIHKDSSIQSALILEDDAQFSPNFMEKVFSVSKNSENLPWELFYLGRKKVSADEETVIVDDIVIPEFSYWCLSYVVNKVGALKLCESKFCDALIPADEFVPLIINKSNSKCLQYKDNYNLNYLKPLALKEQIIKPETSAFHSSNTEKTSVYFKNEFYNDGKDKFILLTVATEENDHLDRFRKSCEYYGVPYKILGLGEDWNGGEAENGVLKTFGGGQKINLLKKELSTWTKLRDHIIMFTDSYDVVLLQNPQTILWKFREFKTPIVFSAEKTCWPNPDLRGNYPNSETDYRFLNSGGFIGYADQIMNLIKDEVEDNDDDQLYYTLKYLNGLNCSGYNVPEKSTNDIPESSNPFAENGHQIGWMSEPVFDKEIVQWLKRKFTKDSKILDVGAGDGKWGYVLGEHFDNIDAVEIFEPYIERYDLKKYYKKIFVENFLNLDFDFYDVIIMGDVFEHVTKEEAHGWINKVKDKCSEIIIVVPFGYPQDWDGEYENKWGHHHQPDLSIETMIQDFSELQLRFWTDKPDSAGKGKGFGFYTKKFNYDYLTNIFLDTNQYIFQTLNQATDDIDIDMVGRISNKKTRNYPAVLHANGSESVKKYLDLITDYTIGNFDFFYGNKTDLNKKITNKTICVGLFLNHDLVDINQPLNQLSIINYPKNKIDLHLFYNSDDQLYKIKKFSEHHDSYKNISIHRTINLIEDRIILLNNEGYDYYLFVDSNYIFRNVSSLQILISADKKIISPMIVSEGSDYVNFHVKEQELKKEYVNYSRKGIWSVDASSGIFLIKGDFTNQVKQALSKDTDHSEGDWDVKMCDNLRSQGNFSYICNTNYFGTII